MATLVASAVAASMIDSLPTTDAARPPSKAFEVVVPPPSSPHNEFKKYPEIDAAVEEESEGEDIEPAFYYEDMGIPVFTPVCFPCGCGGGEAEEREGGRLMIRARFARFFASRLWPSSGAFPSSLTRSTTTVCFRVSSR